MDTTGHMNAALAAAKDATSVTFELEYGYAGSRLYAELPGGASILIAPAAGGRWQATRSTMGPEFVPSVSEVATGDWEHVAERVIAHLTGDALELPLAA